MNDQIKLRQAKPRVRLVGRSATDRPFYQAELGNIAKTDTTGAGAYTKLMNALAAKRGRA